MIIPNDGLYMPGGLLREEFENKQVKIFDVQKSEGKDWRVLGRLYSLFKMEEIDIVHTHLSTMWLYCCLPARLAGVNSIIFTEHSNKTECNCDWWDT